MILQDLYNDYETIMKQTLGDDFQELPSGYANKKCHWKISINPQNGNYNFISLNLDYKGKGGVIMTVPSLSRSNDIKPYLVDYQTYVFGRSNVSQKPNYLELRHQAYLNLLNKCYLKTSNNSVKAIIDFLNSDVKFPENLMDDHWITFEVEGEDNFLLDKNIQSFWAEYSFSKTEEDTIQKQCHVSGDFGDIVDVVSIKIKCPSLSKDGLVLITANDETYEHYGWEQAQNSPLSLEASEKTHNALNELFRSSKHSKKVGKNVYVFWANDDPFLFFNENDPEIVKEFFESFKTGNIWSDYKLKENDQFKIFGFSNMSNRNIKSTRLVVKYANHLSMKQLYQNQFRWLQSIKINNNGKDEFPEFWKLIKTLHRAKDNKNVADYETIIIDCILNGKSLPSNILTTVIRRSLLDVIVKDDKTKKAKSISFLQISLIKACLYDKIQMKGYDMSSEQENCDDVAYNLGRLWALIEKLQEEALGRKPNASITDKNFKSICSLPNKTMGRLNHKISYYIKLLRMKNYGKSVWLDREITKITDQIPSLPDKINTSEQGMFILGYYHKKSSLYSKSEKISGEIVNENTAVN